MPAMTAIESATAAQASSADVITGTRQPGCARSRTSQASSSGTDVPRWSGEDSSTTLDDPMSWYRGTIILSTLGRFTHS